MSDIFVYADESGDLDMSGKNGSSKYFGFGTVIFGDDHRDAIWDAHVLRITSESRGVNLPSGFHAKNDSWQTRNEVFALLAQQDVRVDTTFLLKQNAIARIKEAGEMRLYKMAWYLHFKYLCEKVISSNDHVYAIAASFGTKARAQAARSALMDVAAQQKQNITMCVWDANTCWGLQAADYGLWAVQRKALGNPLKNYDSDIAPIVKSHFFPWGALSF